MKAVIRSTICCSLVAWGFVADSRQQVRVSPGLWASPNAGDDDSDPEYRSVSDYVGGLHGGE